MVSANLCSAITTHGRHCKAYKIKNNVLCAFHVHNAKSTDSDSIYGSDSSLDNYNTIDPAHAQNDIINEIKLITIHKLIQENIKSNELNILKLESIKRQIMFLIIILCMVMVSFASHVNTVDVFYRCIMHIRNNFQYKRISQFTYQIKNAVYNMYFQFMKIRAEDLYAFVN